MIRLTVILLAAIGITLSIAGSDLPEPVGEPVAAATASSASAVQASRADAAPTDLLPRRLDLDDEAGAIARALAAETPAPVSERSDTLWEAVARQAAAESAGKDVTGERQSASPLLARVTGSRVNLRAGPSTADTVLDQVVRDQRVEVLEERSDGWSRIRVPETGRRAWIFDRFLAPLG